LKHLSTRMAVLILSIIIAVILISIIMIMTNPYSGGASGEESAASLPYESTPYRASTPYRTSIDPSKILSIQKVLLYRHESPDRTNVSITLELSVKNLANKLVCITGIAVDSYWNITFECSFTLQTILYPGDTWTRSFDILKNIPNNAPYSTYWERGTEHTVVVYFKLQGVVEELSVSVKAVVS